MDNVILIGMPGVGKSTIGVLLSKVLGYNFIDSDILIQTYKGKLLSDIIQNNGIEEFLKIEDYVNSSIEAYKCVIAPGGSIVYCTNAINHLKNIGTIVYIKQDYDRIKNRLTNINNRGVVFKNNQSLKELYDERSILYESYADIIIEQDEMNIEETINKILFELNNRKRLVK